MSIAAGWTLVVGTLTVQIALLTLVLTVQSRSLRNAIGQATAELRDLIHVEFGGLRAEFAEMRGEVRARLTNLEHGP